MAIFLAYYIIPAIIALFLARRKDIPFPRVLWLFVGFILACGTTHALDALMFWEPVYRLSGLVKLVTAAVSWATVFALAAVMPSVMRLRTPADLEAEVNARTLELRDAEEQLRQADERKNEFLSILGHELRNPLAPITSALDLMNESGSSEFAQPRQVIARQVRHMTRLVDDLLDVSRIVQGKVRLTKTPNDLATTIDEAVEHVHSLIEERGHELRIDVEHDLVVRGDHLRIVQVFSNLLNNAAKYTPPNGRLEIRARRDGHWCQVEVADNGIGISEDLLERAFELFTQDERSLERAAGGLGLGLAIVHRLVELHGGTVTASANPAGRGSVFTVRLPHATTESSSPAIRIARPQVSLAGRSVLVVDDNADARELLALLLESQGMEVRAASDSEEALSILAQWQPALAILDIGLPKMDGYQLARAIGRAHPNVKLIALSGYGTPDDVARSMQAGFSNHLTKPAELSTLRQAIEDALDVPTPG